MKRTKKRFDQGEHEWVVAGGGWLLVNIPENEEEKKKKKEREKGGNKLFNSWQFRTVPGLTEHVGEMKPAEYPKRANGYREKLLTTCTSDAS